MMNRLWILLVAMVAVATSSYRWVKGVSSATEKGILLDSMPELGWLRSELGLSEEQYRKVEELHRLYRPRCRELCARIEEAEKKVRVAKKEKEVGGEAFKEAVLEFERVSAECRGEMIEHLYRTARLMDPEQAEAYLKTTLPFAMEAGKVDKLFEGWKR